LFYTIMMTTRLWWWRWHWTSSQNIKKTSR